MGKLHILHISDIHIGNFRHNNMDNLPIAIADAIEDEDKKVDCVVVTGDIFDGKSKNDTQDVKDAVTLFKNLRKELKIKVAKKITLRDFIFVPGNHDQIKTSKGDVFKKYKQFLRNFYPPRHYNDSYNEKYLFTIKKFENEKVAIIGLNSCMLEPEILFNEETKWL